MKKSSDDLLSRNLVHYRLVAGLNQTEAALAAGVTRAAYVRAEKGDAVPGDGVLNALCVRYRVAMTDFFRDFSLPDVAYLACACENKMQHARRVETLRRVCRQARDRRMLREISGWSVEDDWRSLEKSRSRIAEVCHKYGASEGRAVRNCLWPSGLYTPESLPLALDRVGIILCLERFLDSRVDGFSFCDPEIGWVIAVDSSAGKPFETRLMAVAHELGHILQGTADRNHGSKGKPDESEKAATRFARELLVPKGALEARWRECAGLTLCQRVLSIKRELKVAAKTVLHQAIEFGLAKSDAYACFAAQLKSLGMAAEPEPLPTSARFEDGLYDSLALNALRAGEISESRCAELLGKSMSELRSLLREEVLVNG